MNDKFLTIKEAAEYLDASQSNLRWHIHHGRLPVSYRDTTAMGSPNMFSISDLDALKDNPIWKGRRPRTPDNKSELATPESTLLRWKNRPRIDQEHQSGCTIHWSKRFRYNNRTFVPITCAECGQVFDKPDTGISSESFTGCCTHCYAKRRKQSKLRTDGITCRGEDYISRHIRTFTPEEQSILRQMPLSNDIYILEHRAVMAIHLGRPLLSTESVHHINGVKDDNRIENLSVYVLADHSREHAQQFNKVLNLELQIKKQEQELLYLRQLLANKDYVV